jgi:hypothetical protein
MENGKGQRTKNLDPETGGGGRSADGERKSEERADVTYLTAIGS